MIIERINPGLVELCAAQFWQSGYSKPDGYFQSCYSRQLDGELVTFVAHNGDQYIGHAKLVWVPNYGHYRDYGIPEIQDLNVLPQFRRKGVGTSLIVSCEELASERASVIGIGVGLHPGYNQAQRLYSRLGYLLDGHGVHYQNRPVEMGKSYIFDDSLILFFTKRIA